MIRRATYPGPTSPVLREADDLRDRADHQRDVFLGSALTAVVGVGLLTGLAAYALPVEPVGRLFTAVGAAAGGWAARSTWGPWRRAVRRAERRCPALVAFVGQRASWLCARGRHGPESSEARRAA